MANSTVRRYDFTQVRGSSLEIDTVTVTIGAAVDVPAYTPMALDSTDNLHYPYNPAGSNGRNKALYLSAIPIKTTDSAAKHALIRKGGFNADAINWPESINTLAKKQAVFAGTPISINELDG